MKLAEHGLVNARKEGVQRSALKPVLAPNALAVLEHRYLKKMRRV